MLDGGLKKWKKENKTTNNKKVTTQTSEYSCRENTELVKNKNQIDERIKKIAVLKNLGTHVNNRNSKHDKTLAMGELELNWSLRIFCPFSLSG